MHYLIITTQNRSHNIGCRNEYYNYDENGYKVLVLKPKIDTKGEDYIVSRVGVSRKVDYLIDKEDSIVDLIKSDLGDTKSIFVDEAQFLSKKQVDELFLISKVFDKDVICYGLRLNFKMDAFEGSKRLLEISEELEELKTICKCGTIARFAGRKVNGTYVNDGSEVVIDGTSNVEYIPLCGDCYLKEVEGVDYNKIKKLIK